MQDMKNMTKLKALEPQNQNTFGFEFCIWSLAYILSHSIMTSKGLKITFCESYENLKSNWNDIF